jgi:WD40 repeat protein
MKVWNFTTGRQESGFHGRAVYVHSVAFSPDGRRLATGLGQSGLVKIWDAATRQEVATLKGHTHFVNACFFPDNNTLVTASKNEVLLWRAATFAEADASETAKVTRE